MLHARAKLKRAFERLPRSHHGCIHGLITEQHLTEWSTVIQHVPEAKDFLPGKPGILTAENAFRLHLVEQTLFGTNEQKIQAQRLLQASFQDIQQEWYQELIIAIREGDEKKVATLLERGLCIDNNVEPLCEAVRRNRRMIFHLLVAHGADYLDSRLLQVALEHETYSPMYALILLHLGTPLPLPLSLDKIQSPELKRVLTIYQDAGKIGGQTPGQ